MVHFSWQAHGCVTCKEMVPYHTFHVLYVTGVALWRGSVETDGPFLVVGAALLTLSSGVLLCVSVRHLQMNG